MAGRDKAPPSVIVVFGATGDLSGRKLFPALFHLWKHGKLHKGVKILGVSIDEFTEEAFRDEVRKKCVPQPELVDDKWKLFAEQLHYAQCDVFKVEDYTGLAHRLEELGSGVAAEGVLFYLAVSPELYLPIVRNLGATGIAGRGSGEFGFERVVLEKPFGTSSEHGAELAAEMKRWFHEEDVFLIDHYLGKEVVQGLLCLRTENPALLPIMLNYDGMVESVEVYAYETLGVEGRGQYYDKAGALMDMIQSHLLRVLGFVLMDLPTNPGGIPTEIREQLEYFIAPKVDDVPDMSVRGQYGQGSFSDNFVLGYREEQGVGKDSQTETFAAIRLYSRAPRWAGVPFVLVSGKRHPEKQTRIVFNLKLQNQHPLSEELWGDRDGRARNRLVICLDPKPQYWLETVYKRPGERKFETVKLSAGEFDRGHPAYSNLVHQALVGQRALFTRSKGALEAWRIVSPILEAWKNRPDDNPLHVYPAGSWGPVKAKELIETPT